MLTSGFYNSKGGDRKYDAEQFGAMFNGLIADGVFAHYKDALKVTAGIGNRELVIKPGRAWFNGTWTEVDDDGHSIYLMGSAVEATYFVYLAVNKLDRKNTIAWYSSIANNDPEKGLYFYLLAQVTVPGGATKISDSMITDTRGSDLCPYVTGIMETVSFEEIVKRVCGDNWQDWLGAYEAGITTGVQNAMVTAERALDEVRSLKSYAVESEAVSYIWAKFEAVPTGGGGFEWATDSVHTELTDPPVPMYLFRDLSYADLGPGFKPNISLNSPYIAEGDTAVKAIPAVTQSKVWREYPYFWEGGASFGTEVLRYDDLQRVVVNVGGTVTEMYRYRVSRLMHIPVTYEPGAYIGTVNADNATVYPRDGYKDGYYYMRFAARAEDVSFYYPGLSSKNVRDAIVEVVKMGGTGSGTGMSVIEVEELPSTGTRGVFYIVKKPGDSDASEYLWLDRWEKIGGTGSGQNVALTTAQINALHGMFKVCLFNDSQDVDGAISAFETAFGITDSGDGSGGGEIPDKPELPGGDITGDALPTNGLLGYWDFRSAPERTDHAWHWSYSPDLGEGGAYANISGGTQGTAQPPEFGNLGTTAGFNIETKPETYPKAADGTGFGTQFTLLALTHGGPNNWGSMGSNIPGELCKFNPKYKTESETKQTTQTAIPTSDKTGYHLSAYRVDGAALTMYVNAKQVAALDGNEYDGFVQWDDRLSAGGIWQSTIVATAVYNRPLTEPEIVEAYAFMKTLEVNE